MTSEHCAASRAPCRRNSTFFGTRFLLNAHRVVRGELHFVRLFKFNNFKSPDFAGSYQRRSVFTSVPKDSPPQFKIHTIREVSG